MDMPAGSTIYWLGNTLHAAGANCTEDNWREALFISWAVGWLRQETNQYADLSWDVVKKLKPETQAILGYSVSETLGGYSSKYSGAPRIQPQRTKDKVDKDGQPWSTRYRAF